MEELLVCAACGAAVAGEDRPFRCPRADSGDGRDHVLARRFEVVPFETPATAMPAANPFERYRRRLAFWSLGRTHGLNDAALVEIVRDLDCRVAEVDGRGFVETPLRLEASLGAELSAGSGPLVYVKDETGNVSGSHKARHLMGIMLYLQVAERVGLFATRPRLAIASCGNAALAAAVVARAAGWPLDVFVPPSAHAAVVGRLGELGARISTCQRQAGAPGDPCYLAFKRAVADGAIPFCCQGPDNGLTIEGGATLAWEIVERLDGVALDAIFVQVGGGALASAVVQGFERERRAGLIPRLPEVYAVQTSGGYPLARAYDELVARMVAGWPEPDEPPSESPAFLAEAIAEDPERVAEAIAYARDHRAEFMWPWEEEPRSIAHGILDDETYDWAAVVDGMLRSGGRPIVVGEDRLRQANDLARSVTGIDVDHTGSAGLAGLIEALPKEPSLRQARVAVIFSGVRR